LSAYTSSVIGSNAVKRDLRRPSRSGICRDGVRCELARRLGTPDDIADAVSFTAGADGASINEQVLRADGGMVEQSHRTGRLYP